MPVQKMSSIINKKHRRVQKIIMNGEDLVGGAYHGTNVRGATSIQPNYGVCGNVGCPAGCGTCTLPVGNVVSSELVQKNLVFYVLLLNSKSFLIIIINDSRIC